MLKISVSFFSGDKCWKSLCPFSLTTNADNQYQRWYPLCVVSPVSVNVESHCVLSTLSVLTLKATVSCPPCQCSKQLWVVPPVKVETRCLFLLLYWKSRCPLPLNVELHCALFLSILNSTVFCSSQCWTPMRSVPVNAEFHYVLFLSMLNSNAFCSCQILNSTMLCSCQCRTPLCSVPLNAELHYVLFLSMLNSNAFCSCQILNSTMLCSCQCRTPLCSVPLITELHCFLFLSMLNSTVLCSCQCWTHCVLLQ